MQFFKVAERVVRAALPAPVFAFVHRSERRVRATAWRLRHPGREHSCPFCAKEFGKFIPYVNRRDIAVTADIISGQSISTEKCPSCYAYDRERALYFFFKDKIDFAGKRVLHMAPEDALHGFLASSGCAEYVCGDLEPEAYYPVARTVRRLNLLHLDCADAYFDIIICNHILEHIPDDISAMKEIYRVLKPSGCAILLVPICAKLRTTFEDSSKTTDEERAQAFGQYNHIRIYAESDYLARLRSVGFHVTAESPTLKPTERSLAR